MRRRAEGRRVVLVAHRGVPGAAPENSLAGIAAALGRADIVEVDVSLSGSDLVLAHSADAAGPESPRLRDALAFFAERAPPAAGIQLDVKPRGVEEPLVAAIREHGLLERALVSSTFADVLRAVRALEPSVATALGYPYDRAAVAERRLVPDVLVRAALLGLRAALPLRVARMARSAQADVVSLHHLVLSEAAVRRCHDLGLAVFAWTVNDADDLERVVALGVDGVVTDQPGLVRA
ncbi:MAG TPA: glycerophosphodiester phosphodiesterase [Gaiellaceae bacterium]|nr:glycerophosphodiester phosphodiesterase [Gaiellaceae bacterium]